MTLRLPLYLSFLCSAILAAEDAPKIPAEKFTVEGRPAVLYSPPSPAEGKPWAWYAPTLKGGIGLAGRKVYFDAFMEAGIALAGYDLGEVRGAPGSTAKFTAFYEAMVARGWSAKPILLGQSRGGLMMLSWATANPDRVGAFVGIYPVLNLASWPLRRSKDQTLADFAMGEADLVARLAEFNPVDRLDGMLRAGVPVFVVHGDSDEVVPYEENTALLKERYEKGGGDIEVKVIPGEGHKVGPSFFECRELVAFVLKVAKGN
jgi:alpha-beta hydrolase superfamily lysophospholipase